MSCGAEGAGKVIQSFGQRPRRVSRTVRRCGVGRLLQPSVRGREVRFVASEAERLSLLEALGEPLIESPALRNVHRRFASSTQSPSVPADLPAPCLPCVGLGILLDRLDASVPNTLSHSPLDTPKLQAVVLL